MPVNPHYSTSTDTLLSTPPPWILRSGGGVLFAVLFVVFALSWFIRYPEIASGTLVLHNQAGNVALAPRLSARIADIRIRPGEKTKKNDTLLILESSADYRSLLILDAFLQKAVGNDTAFWRKDEKDFVKISALTGLGFMQPDAENFIKKIREYRLFCNQNAFQKKKIALEKEKHHRIALNQILDSQIRLQAEDLLICAHHFDTDSLLASDGTIANKEKLQTKSALLNKKNAFEQSKTAKINGELQLAQIERNLSELEIQYNEQVFKHLSELNLALTALRKQTAEWKMQHLLLAPFSGLVSMQKPKMLFEEVKQGETIFTLIPDEENVYAIAQIDGQFIGKLALGQRAKVKLEAFPFARYGNLLAEVSHIDYQAKDNKYAVFLRFPEGLKTDNKQILPFRPDMQGTVEIITEEQRLAEKFFEQVNVFADKVQ
jgi:HlyD family secretion protein